MKKTNMLKYWDDELKKYVDLGGVGAVKPSNPTSLATPEILKNTGNKNPLDIYNDYIKESNAPSAPGFGVNPELTSSIPTNHTVDRSQFFDSNVVGTVGGGFSGDKKGGVTDEGEIIGNPNLEKFPTINGDSNLGGVVDYNPKTYEPTSPIMPTTPNTNPSVTPTIPTTPNTNPSVNPIIPTTPNIDTSVTPTIPTTPNTNPIITQIIPTTPNIDPSVTPITPTPSNPPTDTSTTNPPSSTTETTPSNKFSAKYQGTDFLEWYRANYGQEYDPSTILSRKSGMSDVDWAIGDSLYDTYRRDQQRKSDYETRVSALDKSKMKSQQNASITLDKLKKYLPTQIKAQGLGGLGVSESSLLNAYNRYSSDIGAIENDYQDRKLSLEEAYAQDNLQSWMTSKDSVSGIFDGYKTQFENNQKQAYQDAYNTVSQSLEKDESAILKYIEQFRNRISDSDFLTLTQQAKQVAQANKQAYDKEQEDKTNSAYENAWNAIERATYYTQDDFDRLLEQYRGEVTESQFNKLVLQAEEKLRGNLEAKKGNDEENYYTNFQTMQGNIKTYGSDFYSFDDIDRAVSENALSEKDGADLKKFIETTAINELSAYVSAGDYGFAATEADSAYKKGKISKDAYQSLYYDIAIGSISGARDVKTLQDKESYLTNLKNAGKITASDYNSAVSYMYSSAGNVLSSGSYSVSYIKNIFGTQLPNHSCLNVTMGGKTYELETVQPPVDNNTASVLSKMVGGSPKHGSLAQLGDQIYIYRVYPKETDQYKNGWIKVKTYNPWTGSIGTDNKDFYYDYDTACKRQTKPTKPEHNPDSQSYGKKTIQNKYLKKFYEN